MAEKFRTVENGGVGQIEEKRSKFIANVFHVESEEEVSEYVQAMKKKYYDARHNCYGYVIGKDVQKSKASDDGEPSGTAGKPILEVINGEELTDTLVVVTRYFGGTLLGTGGLIRAYTEATKDGLHNSELKWHEKGQELKINVDYTEESKVRRFLANSDLVVKSAEYSDKVDIITVVPVQDIDKVMADLTENLQGKLRMETGIIVWS